MKRVALIVEFDSCYKCPYRSGGHSLGSPMYCAYFDPVKQIFDSNGHNDQFEKNRRIAWFCQLPEDEVFQYN
jgi:hypothetical protein